MKSVLYCTLLTTLAVLAVLSSVAESAVSKQKKCDSGKQLAAAKHAQCLTAAEATNTKNPDPNKLTVALLKCNDKLTRQYTKLESKAPEDQNAGVEDQCSHYNDVDKVKELNAAVSTAIVDGSASTAGVGAVSTCGNGVVAVRQDVEFW